ncbi:MAG: glucose-1-phosphate adenylyltransferase subunit GlgD [Eubacterium sp.]|jgi:glucose-1-phosphate adenylyltransferase|nr:glucose-1-phosphate adenylyltransferase subunit GlgD [Eubacterium sp.]
MAIMANVLGLIFADMHDLTISDLTRLRTMGSVPYGARYRLIDFALSNMVNSGVTEVGVITKSNYQSLLDHLGSGSEWDLSRKSGGLHLLPPYGQGAGLYRGRLDALFGVVNFIRQTNAEYILMADTDIIANLNFKEILDYHEEKQADITVVYGRGKYENSELSTKTVFSVNSAGQIYDVLIRPDLAGEFNTSMNIFVLKKDFLLDLISENAARNLFSFEVDVIQHKLNDIKIFGYKFDGYYEQIDSIISYFKANMALMDRVKLNALFTRDRPIYTKVRDEAPAKYGIDANTSNSLVADGCIIEGTVNSCVLFRGVKVGRGAVVQNSILMQDTVIGDRSEINYVIADKNVNIGSYRSLIGTPDYPVFVSKNSNV